MTFSDLHPEELLCPSGSRTLTADETADLNAHLARCPACLLQLQLGPEIERALPPTEQDYVLAARVAERVLAMSMSTTTATARPATATARQEAASSGWAARLPQRLIARRGAWSRVAIVLFVLLGTGVGAQAIVVHLRERAARSASGGSAGGQPAPAVRAQRRPAARSADLPPITAPLVAPTVPSPPVQPALAPSQAKETPGMARPRLPRAMGAIAAPPGIVVARAEPSAGQGLLAPRSTPVVSPAAAPVNPAESPVSLFRRAERARLGGDLQEANRLFRALGLGFSGTREELASRVLFGQLLLDDLHAPTEALAAFDRYLRDEPSGTLAEEARVGRAQALRQMGRPRDELAAWSDFLAHHPASVHAGAARARLSQLSAIH
ncbi:MAG: hypothetical protein QOI66_2662 [Myxococcales bacterium]|nr:hypothetical protein [Myxococcales bacterium]